MSAGFVVNNSCIPIADAYDFYFSAIPAIISPTTYTYLYKAPNLTWHITSFNTQLKTLIYDTVMPDPSLQSCLTEQAFLDGALFGTLLGTSMVVIGVWGIMRRAV